MAGKTLDLDDLISKDQLGCSIANMWTEWNNGRQNWVAEKKELRRYLYATSTKSTSNSKLPWSNSTTLPKLTQIRDNLYANYIATMFPKRRWLNWEGITKNDESKAKTQAIKDYMMWAVSQPQFKEEVRKLVLDYIDMGNCFGTVEWVDESTEDPRTGIKLGYIGPRVVRINPYDLVMNPIAPSFYNTPKIWSSLMSIGEAKEVLERMTTTETQKALADQVFDYLLDVRNSAGAYGDLNITSVDDSFTVDGFNTYQHYLQSDYVELLTFVGDIYDRENNEFLKNHLVVVIDRHKVAIKKPYPYPLAEVPIYHAGWRVRQDNLWAMGPLDNLVGLQYRLDHVENMKSDIMDLVTYPVMMIKGSGSVTDFEWGPLQKIMVDADGDVQMLVPDVNALNCNIEISTIESRMEEMAGSPKEAMGFRTPGEKTAYEVQRLENAASRIFQNKIAQFEEQIIEPLLNAMLVLARENLTQANIRVVDDEYGVVDFRNITRADLSANGRLRPIAARHFAEQAEMIQNITNWAQGPLGMDPEIKQHFSSVRLAEMIEDVLNLQDYDVVQPYVRISEASEQQRLMQASQEGLMTEAMTPTGLTPDDYSDPSPESVVGEQGDQTSPSVA